MRTLHSIPRVALIGASALVFGAASAAKAAIFTYPNLVGPNVTYQNLTEVDTELTGPPSTSPPITTGFFNTPQLIPAGSNEMMFPANTFIADGADGTFDFEDGKLTFNMVPTTSSSDIHSMTIDEGGAWTVDGPEGSESSEAEATLLINGVSITSVNGVNLTSAIVVTPTLSETASSQSSTAAITDVPGSGNVTINSTGTLASGIWDITADFNFDAALASAGLSGQITGISVGLNNQLVATTTNLNGPLTLASIDKKHINVIPITTPVPEPATLSILVGAGLLLTRRRSGAR